MKNNKIVPEYRALTKNDKNLLQLLIEEYEAGEHPVNPEYLDIHEASGEVVIWSVHRYQKYDEHLTYFSNQLEAEEYALNEWDRLSKYERQKINIQVELTTVYFESYTDGTIWFFTQDAYEILTIDECLKNESARRGW